MPATATIITLADHRRAKAVRVMTNAAKTPVVIALGLLIAFGLFVAALSFAALLIVQGKE